jgi:hypothetical protein
MRLLLVLSCSVAEHCRRGLAHEITEPRLIAEIMKGYRRTLRDLGMSARVHACRTIVDMAVGTARSNHSYGAVCSVSFGRKRTDVLLCNDLMVGHLR